MLLPTWSSVLLSTLSSPVLATAISLDLSSSVSIKNASSIVAKDVLSYYHGSDPGQIPGLFPEHYLWWESGAVWGSLIDYWDYTGDAQYVALVQQALLSQLGPNRDYMPPNQTKFEGNDDQAIWALAAMRAAELRFPNPSTSPSWLDIAMNVFNDQVSRWDAPTCGGGLRWQIYTFNKGYDYKNTMSGAAFFQIAARLAKYTGNQTYADWAIKSYDWTSSVGLINDDYKVFDGAFADLNCTSIDRLQWSYTAAAFMYGSAVMTDFASPSLCLDQTYTNSNQTNTDATWKTRTENLLSSMSVFFGADKSQLDTSAEPGIMSEVACEPARTCNTDQYAFKGLTAQWMGEAMQVAPFTTDKILSYLQSSADGAAKQCSGGPNGTTCGTHWTKSKYDEKTGLGQEFSALNVFLANLAVNSSAPINVNTTVAAQAKGATQGNALTPSSTTNGTSGTLTASTSGTPTASTSGTPNATTSSKPSSGSQRLWKVSWTLLLVVPVALLSLSPI